MIIVDNLPEIIRKITTLFAPESVKLAFCFCISQSFVELSGLDLQKKCLIAIPFKGKSTIKHSIFSRQCLKTIF